MLQDRGRAAPLLLVVGLFEALLADEGEDKSAPRVAALERVIEDNHEGQVLLFRANAPILGDHSMLLAIESRKRNAWCVLPVHEDAEEQHGWRGCELSDHLITVWAMHGGMATCAEALAIYGFKERDPMELS